MTEVFQSIPDTLRPLYKARTAHAAIAVVIEMLRTASGEGQVILLNNKPIFCQGVKSALDGLDSCREEHLQAIVSSVLPQNRVLAHQNLS